MKNKTRKGFRECSNCSRRPARWRIRRRFFFWQIQRNESHCNGWPTQVKKERVSLWWVTYPSKKRKENEGSKVHSKGWLRARKRARKEARDQRHAWGNVRAQRRARRETRAQRRARQEARAQSRARKEAGAQRRTQKRGRVRKRTTLDGQVLKGALERRWGLEGALKMMIEGSKAR
jgi:hypothetical protein